MKKTLIAALLLVTTSGFAMAQTTPVTSDSTGAPLNTGRRVVDTDRTVNGDGTRNTPNSGSTGRYDEKVLNVGDQSSTTTDTTPGNAAGTPTQARTNRGLAKKLTTKKASVKTGGTARDTNHPSMAPTRPYSSAPDTTSPSSVQNSGGGPR